MRLLLCLLQILFLMWVSLIEHYWVILRERRSDGRREEAMLHQSVCRKRKTIGEKVNRLESGVTMWPMVTRKSND
jgi:hypothetical protein